MIKTIDGVQSLCDDETGEVLIRPFWKTAYNHDTDEVARDTGTYFKGEESMTDQSFKDETDMNILMKRIRDGAQIPPVLPEHFQDATLIPDGTEMRRIIAENNATFYLLDPSIRQRFQNDPGQWVETVREHLNAGNLDAVEALGIDLEDVRSKIAARQPETPPAGTSAAAEGKPASPPATGGTKTEPK